MSKRNWQVPWQLAGSVPGADHGHAAARSVEIDTKVVHLLPDGDGGWIALRGVCGRCGESTRLEGATGGGELERCTACSWQVPLPDESRPRLPCMVVDEEIYVLLDDAT